MSSGKIWLGFYKRCMGNSRTPKWSAWFRAYQELNDFLPEGDRKQWFIYRFNGSPSIKDAVEAAGIPHTEVDLILVNGESVSFAYRLQHEDRVSIYPVFESFDMEGVTRLRMRPLRNPAFVLDVHLGKLARLLRLFGFDALYRNDLDDPEIIDISIEQGRVILTRDVGILKHRRVTHGYWVRGTDPEEQLEEVISRFQLEGAVRVFSRCMNCNGPLNRVEKKEVEHLLEPETRKHFDTFFQCGSCGQVYWRGSHYDKLQETIRRILSFTNRPDAV